MGRTAVAGRGHLDRARMGLRIGDELRNRRRRHRRVDHHDQGFAGDARDRRDVAQEVEAEIGIKRGADRVGRTDQQKRVTVGGGAHDRLGGQIAGGAGPVLDHEWLTEPVRQPLSNQPCEDVVGAAGGKADEEADRTRRIGLRRRHPRERREEGGQARHRQQTTARPSHGGSRCYDLIPSSFAAVSPSIAARSASLRPGVLRMWSTEVLVQGNG